MKENWRSKIGKRLSNGELDWRYNLQEEFINFFDEVIKLADIYEWNYWGGGSNNCAITLSQNKVKGKSISVKMLPGHKYKYYATFIQEHNPNRLKNSEYNVFIGETLDDAWKYIKEYLDKNRYIPDNPHERFGFTSGAYEKFIIEKWQREILEKKEKKDVIGV